ncbi:hypothetical protein A616_17040 [Brevibacillus brevis X23]|nr:hypothetical protein A616_17040 [Brevibacillus brevis X23]
MVAIYVRTATHDTEAAHQQIESCMKEVGSASLVLFQDFGVSGLSPNKPQLDLLISRVKLGGFKKIITLNHSRLSRNPLFVAKFVSDMDLLGAEVVFIEQ